jgi:hypothetical protein
VVITCKPPTLRKGQRWHDVPDRRVELVVRAAAAIDPAPYLRDGTSPPAAARRLTADLRASFATHLGEGHEGGNGHAWR